MIYHLKAVGGTVAAVFVVALAVGLMVSLPVPEAGAVFCHCLNVTQQYTPTQIGTGSTCTAAYNDALSSAENEAYDTCADSYDGTCFDDFIITSECTQVGSSWEVRGQGYFRCCINVP